MRPLLLALAVAIAAGVAACGGDDGATAEPLTLEQRALRESDAPGSKADPVETPMTARSLADFEAWRGGYVGAGEIDRGKLEDAGFVGANHETRFLPKTPGAEHTRDSRHVRLLVVQFESEEGAKKGVELLVEQGRKPCPGECATQFEEIDVSGVPDATGFRRFITAQALEETGGEGEPQDAYLVWFADGPFAYEVETFAPMGDASQEQIEEIAKRVYDRVKGAPAST